MHNRQSIHSSLANSFLGKQASYKALSVCASVHGFVHAFVRIIVMMVIIHAEQSNSPSWTPSWANTHHTRPRVCVEGTVNRGMMTSSCRNTLQAKQSPALLGSKYLPTSLSWNHSLYTQNRARTWDQSYSLCSLSSWFGFLAQLFFVFCISCSSLPA